MDDAARAFQLDGQGRHGRCRYRKAIGAIQPEAVYFFARDGKRGGTMVVDLSDASKIPSVAEPLFLAFDANVRFYPCMTPEDLQNAGLDELGKRYA